MKQDRGYSNGVTYNLIIKKFSDNKPIEKKKLYISQAIKTLNDTELLNNIIFKLADTGLVNFNDEYFFKFRKELTERNYTEDINTKIRAEFLSVFLDYDVRATYFQNLTKQEKPKLNIKVRRKQLIHNYDEVFKTLKKQSAIFHNKRISKLPFEQQEDAYKEIIRDTLLFHYANNSKEFKKELKLFKALKDNIEINKSKFTKDSPKLEHPFIVLNAKELFLDYISKHIIEPYIDYSYLFQRLLDEKFIVTLTHIKFMDWLEENNHITENTKDKFLKQRAFRSLNKSTSVSRENNFNIVFKSILPPS
tara:strand:- start:63048 stop:63965 length:918 start_codon:yes stop_codon:yes gene_type:complete